MDIYLLIFLIFLAASFTQGIAGFGLGLMAIPLLSLLIDIKTAIPLCTLQGLLVTAFLSLRLKGHLDRGKVLPLLVGSLPGIAAGVVFLKKADPDLISSLLGSMIFAYALYRLRMRPRPWNIHPFWSYAAGFATGAIGAAFSAGGPPVIIYVTLTGWDKDAIKATLSGFFFTSGLLIAVAHAASGLTTPLVLRYFAASAPGVLLGVGIGSALYERVRADQYLRLILYLLMAMGIMMLRVPMPGH